MFIADDITGKAVTFKAEGKKQDRAEDAEKFLNGMHRRRLQSNRCSGETRQTLSGPAIYHLDSAAGGIEKTGLRRWQNDADRSEAI